MYRFVHGGLGGPELRSLRSFARREQTAPFDGSKLLAVYLALLMLIPSNLAISALGAAGSPANVFGVALFARWLVARVQGATPRGWTFVRASLAFFALAIVASYLAANVRPLTDLEVNGADRGLIRMISWAGVALVALDGLPNRRAVSRVVEVAVAGGVVVGLVGLIQATTSLNPVDYIHIPGLHPLSLDKIATPEIRNGLPRVYGTTSHPIEFATVIVMLIGLAAPLALKEPADRRSRWWLAGLIAMGITFPLAVARSGFLAAAALAIIVIPRLPKRARRRTLIALPLGLVAVHTSFPGLLGTIKGLFFAAADGSEYARTEDYPVVAQYFKEKPLFGRGFGTLISDIYRVLDNQYLLSLVETGLIGLLAYLCLHAALISTGLRTRKIATSTQDRLFCQCLVGVSAASLASAATFDALSFPMFAGVFFFCIGLSGGFARVLADEEAPTSQLEVGAPRPALPREPGWVRALLVTVCALVAGLGIAWVKATPTTWVSSASALVAPANSTEQTRFAGGLSTSLLADIVRQAMVGDDVRDTLYAQGYRADYTVALESGSLEPGTDVLDSGPLIRMQVESQDAANTEATARALMRELELQLRRLQQDGGVDSSVQGVLTQEFVASSAVPERAGGKRAYVAVLALVIVLYYALRTFARRITLWRRLARRRGGRDGDSAAPRRLGDDVRLSPTRRPVLAKSGEFHGNS